MHRAAPAAGAAVATAYAAQAALYCPEPVRIVLDLLQQPEAAARTGTGSAVAFPGLHRSFEILLLALGLHLSSWVLFTSCTGL